MTSTRQRTKRDSDEVYLNEPHIERRLGHVEAEVSGIKTSLQDIREAQSTDRAAIDSKFKALFDKFDSQGALGATNKIAWILIGVTVCGIVVTAMTSIFYQAIGAQSAMMEKEAKFADEKLAKTNDALTSFIMNYQIQHKELDDKLQHETLLTSQIIDAKVSGLESRIQSDLNSWRKTAEDHMSRNDGRIQSIIDYQAERLRDYERHNMDSKVK